MKILSTNTPDTYQVVCETCLWNPGRALPEEQAFSSAGTHPETCPGRIPEHYTKAQIARARKLLSGNY